MRFSFQHFASSQVSCLGDPQECYPSSTRNSWPQDCWARAQPQALLSHLGSANQADPSLAFHVTCLCLFICLFWWFWLLLFLPHSCYLKFIYFSSVSEDITALVLGVIPFPITFWLLLFHGLSPSRLVKPLSQYKVTTKGLSESYTRHYNHAFESPVAGMHGVYS